MPLTSPGNDDDTGENHQPTLRKNTAEPVEQTLKQNSYLPKGTSFEDLTQDELDAIVGEINDTPMKLLGYKTPNEVWDEEMAKLQSKQADPKPAVALTS